MRHRVLERTLELDTLLCGSVVQAFAQRGGLIQQAPSLIRHEDRPGKGIQETDLAFSRTIKNGR